MLHGIRLLKNNQQIEGKSIEIDCSETVSKDFETVNIDIVSLKSVLDPGEYTAFGEFSKNNDLVIEDKKIFFVIQN